MTVYVPLLGFTLYVGIFYMANQIENGLPMDKVPWWLEFGIIVVLLVVAVNLLYIGRLYGARSPMKEEVESWKREGEGDEP